MKEYIEKSIVERMLWAVIMSKDECTIEEMLEDASAVQAIPIPEGATNGDMIKALFPSDANELDMSKLHLMYDGLDYIKEFRKDWWNAPYRADCIPSEYDCFEDMELRNPQMHR